MSRIPRSRLRGPALLAAVALGLAACGGADDATDDAADNADNADNADDATPAAATGDPSGDPVAFPLDVTDCDDVVVLDEQPESVLTIGQAALWLIDAAGAGDRVAARTGEFGAEVPEALSDAAASAPIADPADPSLENIVGAEVDAVVGYGLFATTREDVESSGAAVLTVSGECGHDEGEIPEPVTFDTVIGDVERFGEVFGTADVASDVADTLRAEVAELTEAAEAAGSAGTAANVYYFSSAGALSANGATGIANAQLAAAGLDNVFGDQQTTYLDINIEALLDADPDVIVLTYGLYGESAEEAEQKLLAEPGVADLTAVQEDRVVLMPAWQVLPAPGAVDGLRTLVESVS
ncbi:MAG: ABC transporter substrate-binding protein [Kineosporiaceae bacterium]